MMVPKHRSPNAALLVMAIAILAFVELALQREGRA